MTDQTNIDTALGVTIPSRHARGRMVRIGPALDAILANHAYPPVIAQLPSEIRTRVRTLAAGHRLAGIAAVLFEGDSDTLHQLNRRIAELPGAIVPVFVAAAEGDYPIEFLLEEKSVSTNTAAAGGNASLMTLG